MVKWISLMTSDHSLGVRVPPGAPGVERNSRISYNGATKVAHAGMV